MADEEDEVAARGARHATASAPTSTTVHVGPHGTTPTFDGSQEEWAEYVERLESYFLANNIGDPGKKCTILVNAVGPTTYRLIKTLSLPEKPSDHSFEEIVKRVESHFHPKPSPLFKQYEFNGRKQRPGETIAEFTAALRKIAQDCEYGAVLGEMLRDRLVFGVADKRLQNHREQSGKSRPVSTTEDRRPVCVSVGRKEIHKVRPVACVPTSPARHNNTQNPYYEC